MGVVRLASVIDHCIPARDYKGDFFDQDNLYPLCATCHSEVTTRYDNIDAHQLFKEEKHYADIKYSGREFARDDFGFSFDEELDRLLSGRISIPRQFEKGEDAELTDPPANFLIHCKNRRK